MSPNISQLDEYLSLRIIEVSRDCDHSVFCCMSQIIFWKKKGDKREVIVVRTPSYHSQNGWGGT